jgi:hypothetical protein
MATSSGTSGARSARSASTTCSVRPLRAFALSVCEAPPSDASARCPTAGSLGSGVTIRDVVAGIASGRLKPLDNPELQATQKLLAERKAQRDAEMAAKHGGRPRTQPDRPTHFLCFRVTNPAIRQLVASVQSALVEAIPALDACVIPPTALHGSCAIAAAAAAGCSCMRPHAVCVRVCCH